MRIGCVVSVNPRAWSCQNHYVSQQRFYQRQNIINKNEPIIHRVSPSIWSCFFKFTLKAENNAPRRDSDLEPFFQRRRSEAVQKQNIIYPDHSPSLTIHSPSIHHPFTIHSPSIHQGKFPGSATSQLKVRSWSFPDSTRSRSGPPSLQHPVTYIVLTRGLLEQVVSSGWPHYTVFLIHIIYIHNI